MTTMILLIYAGLLKHYKEKWRKDRIDQDFYKWEEAQNMRTEMGFDDKTIQRIPKRRIKNNRARKKHGY